MKSYKRRRFGNKKTRRIKKRGGMHKHPKDLTPKERAEAFAKTRENDPTRNDALTAAHIALEQRLSRGVSPGVRNALLTRGTGALAGRVVGSILAENYMPVKQATKLDQRTIGRTTHSAVPAMLEADDIFQQAERLCSSVRALPHDKCWTTLDWRHTRKSDLVKNTCSEARGLYTRAVEMNYLPAYAPLAWMMSREDPEGSMRLCDECIKHGSDAVSRKAKLDCTAIRAFADQESLDIIKSQMKHSGIYHPDDEALPDPELEKFEAIMKKSISENSKYGHAMKWLWLSYLSNEDPNPDEIAAQKKIAEDAGIDFDRCR